MKTILFMAVLGLSMTRATTTASCVGSWVTIDDATNKKKSIVELFKTDTKLYGKIIKLYPREGRGDDPKCVKCTGDKKNKPILGMQIVSGLKWNGEEWAGGTIVDPENGKTYSVKLWVDADNDKKLSVRGYIGPFFRTQTWLRLED
jgi:uncharacterized protein (DUF2147 family)